MQAKVNISQRSMDIPPFLVMDVLERAMELTALGEDIIHLEVPVFQQCAQGRRIIRTV